MVKIGKKFAGGYSRRDTEKSTYEDILDKITEFELAYDDWMKEYGFCSNLTRCSYDGKYLYLSQIEDLVNSPLGSNLNEAEMISEIQKRSKIKKQLVQVRKMVKTIVINNSSQSSELSTVYATIKILSSIVYGSAYLPAVSQAGIDVSNSKKLLDAEEIEKLQEAIETRLAIINADLQRYGLK